MGRDQYRYHVNVIDTEKKFDALSHEYQQFIQQCHPSTYLQSHYYISQSLRSDDVKPLIIIIRVQESIIFCAPFYIQHSQQIIQLGLFKLAKLKTNRLQLYGDNFIHNKLDSLSTIYDMIINTLKTYFLSYDIFFLCCDIRASIYHDFMKSINVQNNNLFCIHEKIHANPIIKLPESYDVYLSQFSSKTRGKLLRRIKKLQSVASTTLEPINCEKQLAYFYDEINKVYQQSWKHGRLEDVIPNINELHYLAQQKLLRSYLLKANNITIAFLIGYQENDCYIHLEPAYDQQWKSYAPGSVLNLLVLKDLFTHNPPKSLDFGYGQNEYKTILSNDSYDVAICSLTKRFSKGHAIITTQHLFDKAYLAISTILKKIKIDSIIRKYIKK